MKTHWVISVINSVSIIGTMIGVYIVKREFQNMLFGSASQFKIGQILAGTSNGTPVKAIVLDKAEDSGALLLMTLSDGNSFEVSADQAKAWTADALPEARWMEVSDGEDEAPFFAAYLPTLKDAIAAARVFNGRGEFRVEIFTATEDEEALVAQG